MKDFEVNILVAGRTGCGKSAFVNYLYGAPVRNTGAGRPITERGLFCERLALSDGIVLNVHDAWGMEPDRVGEWEALLLDEMERRAHGGVEDWFHTVFYCFSVASARVEECELLLLRSLMQQGCQVLAVLTHCDAPHAPEAAQVLRRALTESCGMDARDVLEVCSVEKTLLTGQTVRPFGRERVLARLREGLWPSLRARCLAILRAQAEEEVARWYAAGEALIARRVRLFNMLSPSLARELAAALNGTAQDVMAAMRRRATALLSGCLDAYGCLMHLYGTPGVRVLAPELPAAAPLCCELTASERNAYAFTAALLALIPVYNLTVPYRTLRARRGEITLQLMKQRLSMQEQLRLYLADVERTLLALRTEVNNEMEVPA